MAAVTAAPSGRSLAGKVAGVLAARKKARSGARAARMAAVVAKAREHVLTVAALVSADLGAFHWGPGVGWLAVGGSLLALDFAVRG